MKASVSAQLITPADVDLPGQVPTSTTLPVACGHARRVERLVGGGPSIELTSKVQKELDCQNMVGSNQATELTGEAPLTLLFAFRSKSRSPLKL